MNRLARIVLCTIALVTLGGATATAQDLSTIGISAARALAAGALGQTAFRRAVTQFDAETRAYVEASKSADPMRIRESVTKVDAALVSALSPEIDRPDRLERLIALLQYAERFPPEAHPVLHTMFQRRTTELVTSIEPDKLDAFRKRVAKLWSDRTSQAAAKTLVTRMLFATSLETLLKSQAGAQQAETIALVAELFAKEIAWLPRPSREVPIGRAVQELGESFESRTIYPLLDAIEVIYEIATKEGDPAKAFEILDPFVVSMVDGIGRTEVRVKHEADPNERAPIAQRRLWFHLSDMLRRWTGEKGYERHEEWAKLAAIYFGPERAQKFDFVAARARAKTQGEPTDRSTQVVRGESTFFGVEAKSSRFLIIVDISDSMRDNPQNVDRLTALQNETIRFLRDLPAGVHYNILPFASSSEIGRSLSASHDLVAKTLPRGSLDSKTMEWIRNLRTDGATRVDLAFQAAFGIESSERSGTSGNGFRPKFDEIYFITDGSPTDQSGTILRGQQVEDLLEKIRGWNAKHRVAIHVFGFVGMSTQFIERLANENRGTLRMIKPDDLKQGS